MGKDSRDTVLSVRVSPDEQERLRAIAKARGLSVSDLIRSFVNEATGAPKLPAPPTTVSARSHGNCSISPGLPGEPGVGVFWDAPDGAVISGGTITLNCR